MAAEHTPLSRHLDLCDPAHQLFVLAPEADQFGNRDHQQAVFGCELSQLRDPGHSRLLDVYDFTEDSGRLEPGHPRKVDCRLRVPRTFEDSASARLERHHMTRASEMVWCGRRIDQRTDRCRPIAGRDARGRPGLDIDAHEECRFEALGVICDHRIEFELPCALACNRGANESRCMADEERDRLGRRELGGHDQVAFVLSVLVVDDNDDLAALDGRNGVFNRRERRSRVRGHVVVSQFEDDAVTNARARSSRQHPAD